MVRRRRKRGIVAAVSRVSKTVSKLGKRRKNRSGPKGDYHVTHDPFSYSSDPDGYRRMLRKRLGRGK